MPQCENSHIFLQHTSYVKSRFGIIGASRNSHFDNSIGSKTNKMQNLPNSKNVKMALFENQNSLKLISRKI